MVPVPAFASWAEFNADCPSPYVQLAAYPLLSPTKRASEEEESWAILARVTRVASGPPPADHLVVSHAVVGDTTSSYSLWDAQLTGALAVLHSGTAPYTTLTSVDAAGTVQWSVSGNGVTAVAGRLTTAMVAVFDGSVSDKASSGHIVAYNAGGGVRFRRASSASYVYLLCDTLTRLVWAQQSPDRQARLFVYQAGVVHQLTLPNTRCWLSIESASAEGDRVCLALTGVRGKSYYSPTYWIRVSAAGVPSIVSGTTTEWIGASLNPSGTYAAVMSINDGPNYWVRFGRFAGRQLPSEVTGLVYTGAKRIFVTGGYAEESSTGSWAASTAEVISLPSLTVGWERTWLVPDMAFRFDPAVDYLLLIDPTAGTPMATNTKTGDSYAIPGIYADIVPVAGGKLATISGTGVVSYIDNPAFGK